MPPRFSTHWWFLPNPAFMVIFPAVALAPHLPICPWHAISRAFPSSLFIINIDLWIFIFQWFVVHYYIILVFKLSQIWPLGSPWIWLLCLCDILSSFFWAFSFQHNRMSQTHHVPIFISDRESTVFPKSSCSFEWGIVLETKISVLGVLLGYLLFLPFL